MARGLLAALAAAVLSSCQAPADKTDDLLIGVLLPFSGDLAATATNHERAMQLAVAQINQAGGVAGRRLRLVTRDTHSEVARGLEAARELLDDVGVLAMIGPVAPDVASATLWESSARQVAQLLPSVMPKTLQPFTTLRLAPPVETIACVLARRVYEDGRDQALVMHSDDTFNTALAQAFSERFAAFSGDGAAALAGTVAYQAGQYSYREPIDQAVNSLAQAVVLATDPTNAATVIRSWATMGVDITWYLGPFLDSDAFLENVPDGILEGSVGIVTAQPDYSEQFARVYRTKWLNDVPLTSSLFYYDAVALVALALEAQALSQQAPSAEGLDRLIKQVSMPPGRQASWAELPRALDTVRAGEDLDYVGVSGPADLGEAALRTFRPLGFWSLQDDRVVIEQGATEQAATYGAFCDFDD